MTGHDSASAASDVSGGSDHSNRRIESPGSRPRSPRKRGRPRPSPVIPVIVAIIAIAIIVAHAPVARARGAKCPREE